MATTGKVPFRGFKAGLRKFLVWRGFSSGSGVVVGSHTYASDGRLMMVARDYRRMKVAGQSRTMTISATRRRMKVLS